jgi:hypothetical protein
MMHSQANCGERNASHFRWVDLVFMVRIANFLLLSFLLTLKAHAQEPQQSELMPIPAIRRLPPARVAQALPVRVRGVVTWHSPLELLGFIVDDGKEGIYCDLVKAGDQRRIKRDADIGAAIEEGTLIEVEGVTDLGQYAPTILPSRIKVLGTAPLPEPKATSFGELCQVRWTVSGSRCVALCVLLNGCMRRRR